MSDAQRAAALCGVILVLLGVALFAGADRQPLPGLGADAPVVGRPLDVAGLGRDPRFHHVRSTTDAEREEARRAEVRERFDAELVGDPWPTKLRTVMVHPLAGDPPTDAGEEGPPWHLVVGEDGVVLATERLRRGQRGVPSWVPAAAGSSALHVLVPRAARMPPERRRALADLFWWLERRLGRRSTVLLASDVPGVRAPFPAGAVRAYFQPEEIR